jgi:hypothetical protein
MEEQVQSSYTYLHQVLKMSVDEVIDEGPATPPSSPRPFSDTPPSSLGSDSEQDSSLELPPSSSDEVKIPDTPPTEVEVGDSDIEEIPRDTIGVEAKLNDLEIKDEDSDIEEILRVEVEDPQVDITKQVIDVMDGGAVQLPQSESLGLKFEWLGTSSCYIEAGVQMQLEVCLTLSDIEI